MFFSRFVSRGRPRKRAVSASIAPISSCSLRMRPQFPLCLRCIIALRNSFVKNGPSLARTYFLLMGAYLTFNLRFRPSVLYGTYQRTSRCKPTEVKINQTKITESNLYEYLGVKMDKNLSFSDHPEKATKKAISRLKLLSRMRQNISPYTAETIYKVTRYQYFCSLYSLVFIDSKFYRDIEFFVVSLCNNFGTSLDEVTFEYAQYHYLEIRQPCFNISHVMKVTFTVCHY